MAETYAHTLILPAVRQPAFQDSQPDAPFEGYPLSGVSPASATPYGGKLLWVGNATVVVELNGIRFLTDPNFLHKGDAAVCFASLASLIIVVKAITSTSDQE